MVRNRNRGLSPGGRNLAPILLALATSTLLAGCGGGDAGEVASTPPPPPAPSAPPAVPSLVSTSVDIATIPSPATRPGKSDTIALINHSEADGWTSRLAAPSEIRITTYQAGPDANEISYTIEFATAELPGGKSSLTSTFKAQSFDLLPNGGFAEYRDGTIGKYVFRFGDTLTATGSYSDGSSKVITTNAYRDGASEETMEALGDGKTIWQQLFYSTGLSHVALGEWMWRTIQPNGIATDAGTAFFVHGDRTPAVEIPTSGTATYSAASLGSDTDTANWNFPGSGASVQIGLTADFGQRSISAQLNRDAATSGDAVGGYTSILALDAHGTGQISSPGDFTIPLSGTVGTAAATGSLDGAFFGPNASQVGGVFSLGNEPGKPLVSDAFVGARN